MEFKKYLGKYATSADVQSAIDSNTLSKPYVAYIESGDTLDWDSCLSPREIPLTFVIQSDGNIIWKAAYTGITRTIQYSINGGEWTNITSTTTGTSISVYSGDTVQFRGNNSSYCNSNSDYYECGFSTTCSFSLKGNIMSLINSTDFANLTSLPSNYTFIAMFKSCTGLTDASKLLLPATTLSDLCYYRMFQSCNKMVNAPELPATTIMRSCYDEMFQYCNKLNYIKCLATEMNYNPTDDWVYGVARTGTFVTPASTNWTTGKNGIPSGWTRVDA